MKWISVEERLPNLCEWILVIVDNKIMIGKSVPGTLTGFMSVAGFHYIEGVTKWIYLNDIPITDKIEKNILSHEELKKAYYHGMRDMLYNSKKRIIKYIKNEIIDQKNFAKFEYNPDDYD